MARRQATLDGTQVLGGSVTAYDYANPDPFNQYDLTRRFSLNRGKIKHSPFARDVATVYRGVKRKGYGVVGI
jgi:hypothetical protein